MVHIENKSDLRKKVQKKIYEYQRKDFRIKVKFPIQNANCETITLQNAIKIIESLESDKCVLFVIVLYYLIICHIACVNFHLTELMEPKYIQRII